VEDAVVYSTVPTTPHTIAPPSSYDGLGSGEQRGGGGAEPVSASVSAANAYVDKLRSSGVDEARDKLLQMMNALPASYKDPLPPKFRDRLQRAMEKNIDYIRRKDMEERARILGMGGDPDDAWSFGPDQTGKKRGRGGNRKVEQSRLGIGAGRVEAENTSVYVAGLPQSITWAQMDLLFSPFGRVKRIKVYRDDAGKPKGDALVTYVKQGSVASAIQKMNGHTIAPGMKLHVSPADFSHKDQSVDGGEDEDGVAEDEAESSGGGVGRANDAEDVDGQGMEAVEALVGPLKDEDFDEDGVPRFTPLPDECRPEQCPTCVLRNVYTAEQAASTSSFLDDLEAEILRECIQFGSVVCVVTPSQPYYVGAVCVTFEDIQAAQHCGEVMDGRFFDYRTMQVQALGNWGDGNIIPTAAPGSGGGEVEVTGQSTRPDGTIIQTASAASQPGAAGSAPATSRAPENSRQQQDDDPLAAFLNSV